MTNKDFHLLLLSRMDKSNFISNEIMNMIAIEYKDIRNNLDELITQGKVVKTTAGYIIKK